MTLDRLLFMTRNRQQQHEKKWNEINNLFIYRRQQTTLHGQITVHFFLPFRVRSWCLFFAVHLGCRLRLSGCRIFHFKYIWFMLHVAKWILVMLCIALHAKYAIHPTKHTWPILSHCVCVYVMIAQDTWTEQSVWKIFANIQMMIATKNDDDDINSSNSWNDIVQTYSKFSK